MMADSNGNQPGGAESAWALVEAMASAAERMVAATASLTQVAVGIAETLGNAAADNREAAKANREAAADNREAAKANREAAADNREATKTIVEAMRQMGDMVADNRIAALDNRRAADINRETAKVLQDLADGMSD